MPKKREQTRTELLRKLASETVAAFDWDKMVQWVKSLPPVEAAYYAMNVASMLSPDDGTEIRQQLAKEILNK